MEAAEGLWVLTYLQLTIVSQWLLLNPFASVETAFKWEGTEKKVPLGEGGWVSSGKRYGGPDLCFARLSMNTAQRGVLLNAALIPRVWVGLRVPVSIEVPDVDAGAPWTTPPTGGADCSGGRGEGGGDGRRSVNALDQPAP